MDLDCFYVAVERTRDPALIGRPVIVGGLPGERGVVACASYEARRYGVHAGMPIFQAVRRLPRRETVFLRGDHPSYVAKSKAVMEVLTSFSPAVEPLSLDEAWLDLRGLERHHPSWIAAGRQLHDAIREATGLSASIGIGGSRIVAHVATRFAKPEGVMEVRRGEEARFLEHLPLRWLPGVGPKVAEALARFHLQTIGDLAAVPVEILRETFGRNGETLHIRAQGRDGLVQGERREGGLRGFGMRAVEADLDQLARPKSISRESSFHKDSDDPEFIAAMCSYLAQRATSELREQRLRARSVEVRICYSDFQVARMRRRLPTPTDRDDPILAQVARLWPRCWSRRVRLRRVGVALHGIEAAHERQLDLFEDRPVAVEQVSSDHVQAEGLARVPTGRSQDRVASVRPPGSNRALDQAIDCIRERHGFGAVTRGQAISLIDHLESTRTRDTQEAPDRARETAYRNEGFLLRTPACSR